MLTQNNQNFQDLYSNCTQNQPENLFFRASVDTKPHADTKISFAINDQVFNKNEDANGNPRVEWNTFTYGFRNVEATPKERMQFICRGWAIVGSKMKEDPNTGKIHRCEAAFESSRTIILDYDNSKLLTDANGKAVLDENGKGIKVYDPVFTLHHLFNNDFVAKNVNLAYLTPSHAQNWDRIRLIIDLPYEVSAGLKSFIAQKIGYEILPGADEACKDNCRGYFGCNKSYAEMYGKPGLTAVVFYEPNNYVSHALMRQWEAEYELEQKREEIEAKNRAEEQRIREESLDTSSIDIQLKNAWILESAIPTYTPGNYTYEELRKFTNACLSVFGVAEGTNICSRIWRSDPSILSRLSKQKEHVGGMGAMVNAAKHFDPNIVKRLDYSNLKPETQIKLTKHQQCIKQDTTSNYVEINTPFLTLEADKLGIMPNGITLLKAATSTGKSSLCNLKYGFLPSDKKIIVVNCRRDLAKQLCDAIGIPYFDKKRIGDEEYGKGFGICIQSFHRKKVSLDLLDGAVLLFDEGDKTMKSRFDHTCASKPNRTERDEFFKEALNHVLNTGGEIVVMDADMDATTEFHYRGYLPENTPCRKIVNTYSKKRSRTVSLYQDDTPAQLMEEVFKAVLNNEQIAIFSDQQKLNDSKKSQWSTSAIETNLRIFCKEQGIDRKIVRIDSETTKIEALISTPEQLNKTVNSADVVPYSPTMSFGCSIDSGHRVKKVFAIINGIVDPEIAKQSLDRFRDFPDIEMWVNPKVRSLKGNGETDPQKLFEIYRANAGNAALAVRSKQGKVKRVYEQAAKHIPDLDRASMVTEFAIKEIMNVDNHFIRTQCRIDAKENFMRLNYTQYLLESLKSEGATIEYAETKKTIKQKIDSGDAEINVDKLSEEYKALKARTTAFTQRWVNQAKYALEQRRDNITNAADIDEEEYNELIEQSRYTQDDQYSIDKHLFRSKYLVEPSAAKLARVGNKNRSVFRLGYYLWLSATKNNNLFLTLTDNKALHRWKTENKTSYADLKLYQPKVDLITKTGLMDFVDGIHRKGKDLEIQNFKSKVLTLKDEIKKLFGFGWTEKTPPMTMFTSLCKVIGLEPEKRKDANGERLYAVSFDSILIEIYQAWEDEDISKTNHLLNGTDEKEIFSEFDQKIHYSDGEIKPLTFDDQVKKLEKISPKILSKLTAEEVEVFVEHPSTFILMAFQELYGEPEQEKVEKVEDPFSDLPLFTQ